MPRIVTTAAAVLATLVLAGGSASAAEPAAAAGSPAPSAPAAGTAETAPAASASMAAATLGAAAPAPPSGGLPFKLQTPPGWVVRQDARYPGLWLGPANAALPGPDMVWVRQSPGSLADREAVAANIRSRDAADDSWEATVELRDVNGLECLLVQMDAGEGAERRSSMFLKVPHGDSAVDFVVSAPEAEFDRRRAEYERILLSVHPIEGAPPP